MPFQKKATDIILLRGCVVFMESEEHDNFPRKRMSVSNLSWLNYGAGINYGVHLKLCMLGVQ